MSLLFIVPTIGFAQNLSAKIQSMKTAYSASGSLVALDGDSIVISPKMPSPICGLLMNREGKTGWTFYTFPLASITVPLSAVDESMIVDNRVFTDPNVADHDKPGAVGDATSMVYDLGNARQAIPHPYLRSRQVLAAWSRSTRAANTDRRLTIPWPSVLRSPMPSLHVPSNSH